MREILVVLITLWTLASNAQSLTQTIRGKIIDSESKTELIGAHVVVSESDPFLGTITDVNGEFRIDNVPVGRVSLVITYLGYEQKFISNLLLGAGKELVLTIDLVESLVKMSELEIKGTREHKSETVNEMSLISARAFTVEETKRYAGSLNDPARMASAYAGVLSNPEGNNDIIVRGNSPKGILWKIEGIEIPNPNHFSDEGSSGGGISALNSSTLANSDFYTGAFAPEYGNAYSGVFDIKLRNGNNQKRENAFSFGILGTDITTEGPFKEEGSSSYILNYRYSTLALLDQAGVVDFDGVPKFQDASFKIILPTDKIGVFSIFGLGGISTIDQEINKDEKDKRFAKSAFHSNRGTIGITNTYSVSDKTYLKTILALSGTETGGKERAEDLGGGNLETRYDSEYRNTYLRLAPTINTKLNARNSLKSGIILTSLGYNLIDDSWEDEEDRLVRRLEQKGESSMGQAFMSWKFRLSEKVTFTSGLHTTSFFLNNSHSFEPRIAMKWQFHPRKSFSAGFGVHSRVESLSLYLAERTLQDGSVIQPNKELELAKANHFVLGYDNRITSNLYFKAELYYQQLYDVPVEDIDTSAYSVINQTDGFTTKSLVNKGEGRNYGLEVTLERYFQNNYYFLITTSLFNSKYEALDGIERNTKFNSEFAANALIGKEFIIGRDEKPKTLGISLKGSVLGGRWETPLNVEASETVGYTVDFDDRPYSRKGDPILKMDIGITYRINKKKTTREWKVEVLNFTNNQTVLSRYYDNYSMAIEENKQLPLFPSLSYKIEF